jgi:hypothetical protein
MSPTPNSETSIPTSAHALEVQKAAEALRNQQRQAIPQGPADIIIWLTLGSIAIIGAITGIYLEKFFGALRDRDGDGDGDEWDSDEILEDDELGMAAGMGMKMKRSTFDDDVTDLLLSPEFAEYMEQLNKE